jgi:ABC-2 type transport system permease protein
MWSWLQLPLLIAILVALSFGIAMFLSAMFVRYRDIAPIWEVISQALFYASPVLYVTTMVPESFQHAYAASPLAALFAQMRHAVIDPTGGGRFAPCGPPRSPPPRPPPPPWPRAARRGC